MTLTNNAMRSAILASALLGQPVLAQDRVAVFVGSGSARSSIAPPICGGRRSSPVLCVESRGVPTACASSVAVAVGAPAVAARAGEYPGLVRTTLIG